MYQLNEANLIQQIDDVTYRRGLDLFLRNKVRQLNIENITSDSMKSEINFVISAIVESSFGYDSHTVRIMLNSREVLMDSKCSCSNFKKFNFPCEHMAAVLIKYCRERDMLLARCGIISEKATEDMLSELKSALIDSNNSSEEVYLKVKYYFCGNSTRKSWLEFKIGTDRLYVIKNIDEFVGVVKYKQSKLNFGANFTFDPSIHSFSSKDTKIINLLTEIFEINTLLRNSDVFIDSSSRLLTGKKAYLTDEQAKRFFEIMENTAFECNIDDKDYTDAEVKAQLVPIDFDLKLEDNSIILEQSGAFPVPITSDKEYCFYDGTIYRMPKEQNKLYTPFYNSLCNSGKNYLSFDINYSEQIASFVIPTLKTISRNLDIDEGLSKRFYEVPVKINVYFDKADNTVTADMQFIYNDIIINPLNENNRDNNDNILVRDVYTENKAINILLENNFQKEFGHFVLKDEEELISFLSKGMYTLQEIGDVYYSEEFKNIKIYPPSSIKSSIRLNDNDLLEFSFSIADIDKSELKNILASLRERKKYYKLKKGGFIPLDSKELIDISALIDYLDIKDSDLEKDVIQLRKYNALYIDQSLKQNNMTYVEKNRLFRELVSSIRDINESDFNVPEHLQNTMRSYQKNGFKWFKTLSGCGFGGILADEMGLGKTLQAIAFIESELAENPCSGRPVLVIAPSSLIYNWKNEIEKFSPSLNALVIAGTKLERDILRQEIENTDIVITSYPLIRRDIDDYKEISFRYCIIDEAQHIKNPSSQNAQCVKELKAGGYFALTGTPIENSLTELWSIFDFIMPGYLLSHGKFVKKYEIPIVKDKSTKALAELNKHIRPFILRRLKSEVVKELPDKIEHKLSIEMTEEQKSLYMAYLASAKAEFNNEIKAQGVNKSRIKILSLLTRLRQICCEPSVFIENYQGESGKMLALGELLEDSINEGHRILLFSQFTSVLKSIEKLLHQMEIEYMYLDGGTPVQSRLGLVNKFNDGFGSVFLISLKAGGTGLNLTGADIVIHFDPWWNPAVENQAVDRAHRIGQKKTVEVIKLLARGTIEEKIYELQEKKKEIIKNVIDTNTSDEILISNLSEEEIENLFEQ